MTLKELLNSIEIITRISVVASGSGNEIFNALDKWCYNDVKSTIEDSNVDLCRTTVQAICVRSLETYNEHRDYLHIVINPVYKPVNPIFGHIKHLFRNQLITFFQNKETLETIQRFDPYSIENYDNAVVISVEYKADGNGIYICID